MLDTVQASAIERMGKAISVFRQILAGLRTGRASPALLEPVIIDAYGSKTPLVQLGTISTPEPRLLVVQIWDQSVVPMVEKAIRQNLSLSPVVEGSVLRIRLPELTKERREELLKTAKQYAEEARVSLRNLRRALLEEFDVDLSEDESSFVKKEIQKQTDKFVAEVDLLIAEKEKEILKV